MLIQKAPSARIVVPFPTHSASINKQSASDSGTQSVPGLNLKSVSLFILKENLCVTDIYPQEIALES